MGSLLHSVDLVPLISKVNVVEMKKNQDIKG